MLFDTVIQLPLPRLRDEQSQFSKFGGGVGLGGEILQSIVSLPLLHCHEYSSLKFSINVPSAQVLTEEPQTGGVLFPPQSIVIPSLVQVQRGGIISPIAPVSQVLTEEPQAGGFIFGST